IRGSDVRHKYTSPPTHPGCYETGLLEQPEAMFMRRGCWSKICKSNIAGNNQHPRLRNGCKIRACEETTMKKVLVTIIFSTILLLSRLAAGQAAPGSLDEQLINAAGKGDTAAVQQLLRQGANIEAKNSNDWTALRWAAIEGQIDVVKLLLDKGANIEAKNGAGYTALYEAVYSAPASA